MARIKTYTVDTIVSDKDIVIGTDGDNNGKTKNFQVSDLRQYLLSGLDPETGGNLKITTISATDEVNLTPEDYFNNSEEPIVVLHYEIVFLILNGRTFIFRKNNDIYGVGETQVISSDFTEIDITSVITSSLEAQDLDTVLSQGNESFDKDAKINSLYLWDNHNEDDYGVIIFGDKDRVNFRKLNGSSIGNLDIGQFQVNTAGFGNFALNFPSTASLKNVNFQNASGTVAYLSDIPSNYITDVISNSDEITVVNTDGEIELTYNEQKDVLLMKTYLIDTLTNTTHYADGGSFSFDEVTEPINALKLSFEEDIVSNSPQNFGYYAFHYKDGSNAIYTIPRTGHSISGTNLIVKLPLIDYWSTDLSYFSIHLLVGCVSSATSGRGFKGLTPSGITNYYNTAV
jgi:hypothetical protein